MQGFTVRCGQKVLQNWIKIALLFERSLKQQTTLKYAVQFASSSNLRKETDLENEGHTQVRENCICAGSLTVIKHLHDRVIKQTSVLGFSQLGFFPNTS